MDDWASQIVGSLTRRRVKTVVYEIELHQFLTFFGEIFSHALGRVYGYTHIRVAVRFPTIRRSVTMKTITCSP